MQWCVGLVAFLFLGCVRPPDDSPSSQGGGDCTWQCGGTILTPTTATAHWRFVTLAGASSDCLPGSPSVLIDSVDITGRRLDFSAPCEGGQATHLLLPSEVTVSSMLDHEYSTAVPFTLSPTGDLPIATIYSDAGDVRVTATGVMGNLVDCGTYGFASLAVQLDDSALTEMPCSQAVQAAYSLVAAGPHQAFATGYDSSHAVVAHAGPVDVTALAGTTVDVAVPIGR